MDVMKRTDSFLYFQKNYRFFSLREQRGKWCVMVEIRKNTVFRFQGIC